MVRDIFEINPKRLIIKARQNFLERNLNKAYNLFILVFEHSGEKDLDLKIESCLWISRYFIYNANLEPELEDKEFFCDEALTWLEKAKKHCDYMKRNRFRNHNHMSFSWLRLQDYFVSIKILADTLHLLALEIKGEDL